MTNKDLDSLLRKLEEEREKTFTNLQKELENWKENYERLLKNIETSLDKDYARLKKKFSQINSLIETKLENVEGEAKKELQKLIEEKKSTWIALLQKPIVELEKELSSIQIVKPAFRLTMKVWKLTLFLILPLGFILGGIGGWITGKKLGEEMGQKKYEKKLAEVEKMKKNYELLKPEWMKEWKIETIHDKQGKFPCLISLTVLEKKRGKKTWLLLPEGIGKNDISLEEVVVEKYCIPLDPLHQRHIEP